MKTLKYEVNMPLGRDLNEEIISIFIFNKSKWTITYNEMENILLIESNRPYFVNSESEVSVILQEGDRFNFIDDKHNFDLVFEKAESRLLPNCTLTFLIESKGL